MIQLDVTTILGNKSRPWFLVCQLNVKREEAAKFFSTAPVVAEVNQPSRPAGPMSKGSSLRDAPLTAKIFNPSHSGLARIWRTVVGSGENFLAIDENFLGHSSSL